jgi:hypothetical protein
MNFDLSAASEKKVSNNVQYQKAGIYDNVKISSVELKQSQTGKDFLFLNTLGANGEVGKSSSLWLTDAAWPVTARTLVDLLKATHNVTEDEAKVMIAVGSPQELLSKTSTLLVGKVFRAKFKGEESSRGTVIAVLGGSESMQVATADTKLWFNPDKDIKKYEGTAQATPAVMNPSAKTDDLPF